MDHIELVFMARTKNETLVEGMPVQYDQETVDESKNMKAVFAIVKASLDLIPDLQEIYLPPVMDGETTVYQRSYKVDLDALAVALGDATLAEQWRTPKTIVEIADGMAIDWTALFTSME